MAKYGKHILKNLKILKLLLLSLMKPFPCELQRIMLKFYCETCWLILTLWRPAAFGDFREKKRLNARGFVREFLLSGMLYRPSKSLKSRGKSSSLHSKNFFLLGGCGFFCEWRHKWRTFRPPWPTFPGPGRQPLGGSISLKFLLKTRLQSESFDTLDDLLGFRVQKLWCQLVKTFD